MTHEEFRGYSQRFEELAGANRPVKNELAELARKVAASTQSVDYVTGNCRISDATVPELIYGIQRALQTWAMIDTCRTAAKNHEITLKAQESARLSQWMAVGAMLAAVATAIAAWIWH